MVNDLFCSIANSSTCGQQRIVQRYMSVISAIQSQLLNGTGFTRRAKVAL